MRKFIIVSLLLFTVIGCARLKEAFGLDSSKIEESNLVGEANIPMDPGSPTGLFRNIYFDFDSSQLNAAALEDLAFNINVLRSNPYLKIILEGHCDIRGTKDYNYGLGARRANAVKNYLLSQGLDPKRFETVSYGSDMPIALGNTEEDHAMNRRVHFRVK
jgi:peptidoglycan-associated lipoprotein